MEGRIGRYVGPCHVRKDECMHDYRHSMETVMERGVDAQLHIYARTYCGGADTFKPISVGRPGVQRDD